MTRRPRIGIDVDGICADYVGGYLRSLAELCGIVRQPHEVTGWDIAASLGLTRKQHGMVRRAIRSPGWCYELPVLDGAKDGLRELSQLPVDWYFVTTPDRGAATWRSDRAAWCGDVFGFPDREVIQVRDKTLAAVDYLTDDKPATVEAFGLGRSMLWKTTQNRDHGLVGVCEVDGWPDLLGRVRALLDLGGRHGG